jgi:hypothetical protein
MVPARDEAQAAVTLAVHPHSGFAGVAERIVGGVAEHNTA